MSVWRKNVKGMNVRKVVKKGVILKVNETIENVS